MDQDKRLLMSAINPNTIVLAASLAELAELVDALDSGSSVCKDFRVQVPGSAFLRHSISDRSFELSFSKLFSDRRFGLDILFDRSLP